MWRLALPFSIKVCRSASSCWYLCLTSSSCNAAARRLPSNSGILSAFFCRFLLLFSSSCMYTFLRGCQAVQLFKPKYWWRYPENYVLFLSKTTFLGSKHPDKRVISFAKTLRRCQEASSLEKASQVSKLHRNVSEQEMLRAVIIAKNCIRIDYIIMIYLYIEDIVIYIGSWVRPLLSGGSSAYKGTWPEHRILQTSRTVSFSVAASVISEMSAGLPSNNACAYLMREAFRRHFRTL